MTDSQTWALEALRDLKAAVTEYLTALHSDRALDDYFQDIRGRVVTCACELAKHDLDVLLRVPQPSATLAPGEER